MPAARPCFVLLFLSLAAGPDGPPNETLAEVAGETITRGRVHLYLTLKNVPERARGAVWEETVAHMRERALMRRFLAGRRAVRRRGNSTPKPPPC